MNLNQKYNFGFSFIFFKPIYIFYYFFNIQGGFEMTFWFLKIPKFHLESECQDKGDSLSQYHYLIIPCTSVGLFFNIYGGLF